MSVARFPRHPGQTGSAPQGRRGCGCVGTGLIVVAALAVAAVVTGWILLMHSSLPLRAVGSMIETGGADSNVEVHGLSGSLASGLHFDRISWDEGEIEDVRVSYSGPFRFLFRKELILHEVHVGKAHLTADWSFDKESESRTTRERGETRDDWRDSRHDPPAETPLKLFRIDRVSLNDIVLTDRATGVTFSIPSLQWSGFRVAGEEIDFGTLSAESDWFEIETHAPSAEPYQRKFVLTLLPAMNELIRQPLDVTCDLGVEQGDPVFDLRAFGDTARLTVGADQRGRLAVAGLNLADYIDGPLPQNVSLRADVADAGHETGFMRIEGGSFDLGQRTFELEPGTPGLEGDPLEHSILLARSPGDGVEIRYEIPMTGEDEDDGAPVPRLTSTPEMSPERLLAEVFHGADPADLTDEQQARLDGWSGWFRFDDGD